MRRRGYRGDQCNSTENGEELLFQTWIQVSDKWMAEKADPFADRVAHHGRDIISFRFSSEHKTTACCGQDFHTSQPR
jgi:hypothetical protein